MTLAKIAVGACAALALAAAGLDADAKGGKGGSGGRGGSHSGAKAGVHHSHHHHGGGHGFRYTSVFVGTSFALWPAAYYWPDYNSAIPVVEYWYYCQPYAAYYPYVQECPTEWQPVLPTAPSPEN